MKMHPSITLRMVMDSCARRRMTLDDPGICIACGNEQGGVDPDARKYVCEACGKAKVYGVEELLVHML